MPKKFAPFAPHPNLNPKVFDPNQQTFVPNSSITNAKMFPNISPRKLKLIGAKSYHSTTQAIPEGLGTWTNVTFDSTAFDQGNLYRTAVPTRLTMPYTGIYLVTAFANFANDPDGQRLGRIRLNGATTLMQTGAASLNTADTPVFLSSPLKLTAGDYIQFQVDQNSDSGGPATLNIRAGEDDNFFTAIFLGGI